MLDVNNMYTRVTVDDVSLKFLLQLNLYLYSSTYFMKFRYFLQPFYIKAVLFLRD